MHNPLVTIIIPVYNTSEYLDRCIGSIINQTYCNLDIILVDDGSTDKSPYLCDHYAHKDARVRVIHKENGGQSSSRNRGLNEMNGEWITFVDSDDWIALDTIEYCLSLVEMDQELDIVQYSIKEVYSTADAIPNRNQIVYAVKYSSYEIRKRMLLESIRDDSWFSCCRCLFRKSVIGDMRFREGKINEDIDFKYCAFRNANYVLNTDAFKYYYFQGTGSTTTSFLKKRDFDLFDAASELIKSVKADGDEELLKYAKVKQAKVPLSLLCKVAYFGISDEFDDKRKTVWELKRLLRIELKTVLRSKIKINRKALAIGFLVSYRLTESLIQLAKRMFFLRKRGRK